MAAPLDNWLNQRIRIFWNRKKELSERLPSADIRHYVNRLFIRAVDHAAQRGAPPRPPIDFSTFWTTNQLLVYMNTQDPIWTTNFLQHSVQHVTAQVGQVLDEPALKRLADDWELEDSKMATAAGLVAHILVLEGIAAIGFTTSGVAAGSLAAAWQSTIGNVAAGSFFSSLQSAGAVGMLGGPATLACLAVGVTGYTVYKIATQKSPEEKLRDILQETLNNDELLARFWDPIGCWD